MYLKVIGLCGGSGSGKGAVCSAFQALGAPTIDTDAVYHEVTSYPSKCLLELAAEFGDEIIKDGALDRRTLASRVFGADATAEKRERLNKITHKYVLDEARTRISAFEKAGHKLAVVDAPLLFESGFNNECDVVIAVVANIDVRIQRIVARDNITAEHAKARIASQLTDSWLAEHSDIVIENNGDMSALISQVNEIYKKITI